MSQYSRIHLRIPLKNSTPRSVLEFFKALPSKDSNYGGSETEVAQAFIKGLKPQIENLGPERKNFKQFMDEGRFFTIAESIILEESSLDSEPYVLIISNRYANKAINAFYVFVETILCHYVTEKPVLIGSFGTEYNPEYSPVWAMSGQVKVGDRFQDDDDAYIWSRMTPAPLPDNLKIDKDCPETLDNQGPRIRSCVEAIDTMKVQSNTRIYGLIGDEIRKPIEKFFKTEI